MVTSSLNDLQHFNNLKLHSFIEKDQGNRRRQHFVKKSPAVVVRNSQKLPRLQAQLEKRKQEQEANKMDLLKNNYAKE